MKAGFLDKVRNTSQCLGSVEPSLTMEVYSLKMVQNIASEETAGPGTEVDEGVCS